MSCHQIVVKGQRVRYLGYSKQLVHSPTCPPKPLQKVFFRHRCGCIIGDCVHGEDARHAEREAEFAAKRARSRDDIVVPSDCVDAPVGSGS